MEHEDMEQRNEVVASLQYVHCYNRIMDDLFKGRKYGEEDGWISVDDVKKHFREKRLSI